MTTYRTFIPRVSDLSMGSAVFLDIRGASKDAFAQAIVHEPTSVIGNPDNQQFELRLTGETDAAGNPFVWIIAKHSGMALSVPFSPRFEQGGQVFQQPLMTHAPGREGDVQKWLQVLRHQDQQGQYFVYTNKWSSFALDVQGANPSNNVPVIEFGFNGGDNQLWRPIPGI